MPAWVTSLAVPVLVQVVTGIVIVAVLRQQMADLLRRVGDVEEEKLDKSIHDVEIRRIDDRLDANDKGVQSAGHRMNGIDQRITSVDERLGKSTKPGGS
jgi:hypothetical protein